MSLFSTILICLAFGIFADADKVMDAEEDTGICKLCTDLEKRFAALELKLANVGKENEKSADPSLQNRSNKNLEEHVQGLELKLSNIEKETDNPADSSLLNNTNLEKRVQALEFQMANVHEDITTLNTELADLEEDTEAQITRIQTDISVLHSEQNLQDA